MIKSVSAAEFASQATSERYTGTPYTKLDCQGYVEEVLADCGVRKPDGTRYNWKGSNSMWRNALSWKGTIAECRQQFGEIPLGAWLFIVKNDHGEVERGYYDNQGNASHVGIYCRTGETPVRDSTRSNTRNGVGYRSLSAFTHVGLPTMINFFNIAIPDEPEILKDIHIIRDPQTTDRKFLDSLARIYLYINQKG